MAQISEGDTVLVKMRVEAVGDWCGDYLVSFPDGAIGRWVNEEYIQPLYGKHINWIRKPGGSYITCTNCYHSFIYNGQDWKYCPECGYLLDGIGDE